MMEKIATTTPSTTKIPHSNIAAHRTTEPNEQETNEKATSTQLWHQPQRTTTTKSSRSNNQKNPMPTKVYRTTTGSTHTKVITEPTKTQKQQPILKCTCTIAPITVDIHDNDKNNVGSNTHTQNKKCQEQNGRRKKTGQ